MPMPFFFLRASHTIVLASSRFNNVVVSRSKPFKYCNIWSLAKDFERKVQESWQLEVQGVPMYKLIVKLKRLKRVLKQLNRDRFSDIEYSVIVALTRLTELQT